MRKATFLFGNESETVETGEVKEHAVSMSFPSPCWLVQVCNNNIQPLKSLSKMNLWDIQN